MIPATLCAVLLLGIGVVAQSTGNGNGNGNGDNTLIDPRHRFDHMNLSFPNTPWPVLQKDFEEPPDCGEESYVGSGRLKGRKALITGGDSGMGRAIAIAFAREGADVAINYLPVEEPDAAEVARLVQNEGRRLIRLPGDLRNESFCGELVRTAHERLGGLDILVNHAGFGGFQSGPNWNPIQTFPTPEFDQLFRTNVYAPFFLTRAAIPLLPAGATVLFTASNVAANPVAQIPFYSATKAAVVAFVRAFAGQLAPRGIRVNAVAPGPVYSPFLAANGARTEDLDQLEATPLGRLAQPVEVAPIFVDLADENVSYSTGQVWGATGAHGEF